MGEQNDESEGEYDFHRRQWVVQRLGWFAMLAFIVAACLGLFGADGVAARSSVGDAASLKIEYDRFGRYASASTMTVTIAAANAQKQVTLAVDEAYLQAFEIQSIAPEPDTTRVSDGHLTFTFDADAVPAVITMRLKPDRIGPRTGTFRLPNGPSIVVRQFIYP